MSVVFTSVSNPTMKTPVRCFHFHVFLRNIMGLKVVTIYLTFLSQGLCINLEWWDAEGDGRDFQKGWDIWLIHVEV